MWKKRCNILLVTLYHDGFFACDQQNYILHLKELSYEPFQFNVSVRKIPNGPPHASHPKPVSSIADDSLQESGICCRASPMVWLLKRSLCILFAIHFAFLSFYSTQLKTLLNPRNFGTAFGYNHLGPPGWSSITVVFVRPGKRTREISLFGSKEVP